MSVDNEQSQKSNEQLAAEREKVAQELRSLPQNDPRRKELQGRYDELEKERSARDGKDPAAGKDKDKDKQNPRHESKPEEGKSGEKRATTADPPKLTDSQRQSFRPEKEPELRHFPAGTRFYKHADSSRVEKGQLSEYWSPVEPVTMKDGSKTEGLKDVSERHGGDPNALRDHQRFRSAVSYDWQTKMDQRVVIETTHDQWGYVGKANNQPYHEGAPNVTMMGGDHQVVLPSMKQGDYKVVDKGTPMAGSLAEQKQQNEASAAQRLQHGNQATAAAPPPRPSPSEGAGGPPRRGPTASSPAPPSRDAGSGPDKPDPNPGKGRSR